MEYEFRLITKVSQGEVGNAFMGNQLLEYVVLGRWEDTDQAKVEVTNDTVVATNETISQRATTEADTRHVVVDIDPEIFGPDVTSINLRSSMEDSSDDNILTTIPNGTELDVEIQQDNEEWVKTAYSEYEGFIKKRLNDTPIIREIQAAIVIDQYTLLHEQPFDWETDYNEYYERTQDDRFIPVEGVDSGDGSVVAPVWTDNKYYEEAGREKPDQNITPGAIVTIKSDASVYYGTEVQIPDWAKSEIWNVELIDGAIVTLGTNLEGDKEFGSEGMRSIHIRYLEITDKPEPSPSD